MNDIVLSFVIPVCNVEKYLQECIDSITAQWNERCEIVLVDDGSTDHSGMLCDQNACERIRVIHKANGGLSSARNAGLKYAVGEYISFVDSDDRIALGAINAIFEWIKNVGGDYCFMQGVKFYPNGLIKDLGDGIRVLRGRNKEKIVKFIATRPKFPGSACTKIYKKLFLTENKLFFPNDRRLSEDLGFTRDCILKAKTYGVIIEPFYEYRQNRQGSITSNFSIKSIEGIVMFIAESVNSLTTNRRANNVISKYAMGFVAYEYGILLLSYDRSDSLTKHMIKETLQKYKWILKYSCSIKMRVVTILVCLVGLRMSSRVLNFFKKQ